MSWLAIVLISLALAMDAFAVAVASGVTIRNLRIRHAFAIAGSFGFFQALMPLLGWLCGVTLQAFIQHIDHWIAFGLLSLLGARMIRGAFRIEEAEKKTNPLDAHVLFLLSVATSIDALAAGFSFAMLRVRIVTPALVIGAVTFALSFGGVWLGARGGHFFEKKIEALGGVILIGIGLKILVSHLWP